MRPAVVQQTQRVRRVAWRQDVNALAVRRQRVAKIEQVVRRVGDIAEIELRDQPVLTAYQVPLLPALLTIVPGCARLLKPAFVFFP